MVHNQRPVLQQVVAERKKQNRQENRKNRSNEEEKHDMKKAVFFGVS